MPGPGQRVLENETSGDVNQLRDDSRRPLSIVENLFPEE